VDYAAHTSAVTATLQQLRTALASLPQQPVSSRGGIHMGPHLLLVPASATCSCICSFEWAACLMLYTNLHSPQASHMPQGV
jgi:hypothetical protein